MPKLILLPAVDVADGQAVRLTQGAAGTETAYGDPLDAAKNFLVSQGIEARRVATISYGKERPAVNGSNEAAWSQNRRSVAVVN